MKKFLKSLLLTVTLTLMFILQINARVTNEDIIDWILVELCETSGGASTAISDKIINRQAAFLKKDGMIAGLYGVNMITYKGTITKNMFVIIWHRNHLGIISARVITLSSGLYVYDFSTAVSKVYGGSAGYKNLTGSVWGMAAGDATHKGLIDISDKTQWTAFSVKRGYLDADFNRNVQVNNPDKNNYWLPKRTLSSQVT
jgi:hypothetical protein